MKLNIIGPNQTEVERGNGITVFFSYNTPVAVFVPGQGGLVTNTKYSVTTSRHINHIIKLWGCTKTEVDQGVINHYTDKP